MSNLNFCSFDPKSSKIKRVLKMKHVFSGCVISSKQAIFILHYSGYKVSFAWVYNTLYFSSSVIILCRVMVDDGRHTE